MRHECVLIAFDDKETSANSRVRLLWIKVHENPGVATFLQTEVPVKPFLGHAQHR